MGDESREGLNGLWCWSKLPRIVDSIEGRDVVPVPAVPERLWVETEDGLDGSWIEVRSFSTSPHSVGGGEEGPEIICWRGGRFGVTIVAVESLEVEGVKTRGCGAATPRRGEMDGIEAGGSVLLVLVEVRTIQKTAWRC
jgi:hypothetical protein